MEGLGPPKALKKQLFFRVFANVGFRYFGALDGPLGPILAPLGPIWSQNGSQNGSPDGSKSTPKSLKREPLQVKNQWINIAQDKPKMPRNLHKHI